MDNLSTGLWIAIPALVAFVLAVAMGLFGGQNQMPVDGKVGEPPPAKIYHHYRG